jgi:hypothetical protein
MKTAVEWLFEQYVNKSIITIEDIEQAKEMEEEQNISFARNCLNKARDIDILSVFIDVKKHYDDKFKLE